MEGLIEEYGDPMILNDSGQVTGVNQQCFAALFEKVYKPIFETTEDCFYLYNPSTGLWTVTSKEVLMNKLSLLMKDYANFIAANGITADTPLCQAPARHHSKHAFQFSFLPP